MITAGVSGRGSASLSVDDAAANAGREVEDLVERSLRALPDPSAVRTLARLVHNYADIVLRMPLFQDQMQFLVRHDGDAIIRRIMGEVRQGRPLGEPFLLLALLDDVRKAEDDCPVARAAEIVRRKYCPHLTAETIRNVHSMYRHEFELWKASKYVPGERLTRSRWHR